MRKDDIQAVIAILFIILLFFVVSYYIQKNIEYTKDLIGTGFFSVFIYILILIIAVVAAPINAFPLIPIASSIWGWFITGILNIIGWSIGSTIAFVLSRKYGSPLVQKFISLEEIAKYEKIIPQENIFWSIVFLRISIPVDILSYVLGLFSHIKFRDYLFATIIGVTPFAFIFAYVGTLDVRYQIIAFLIAIFILLVGYGIKKGYNKYKLMKMLKEQLKEQNLIKEIA